MVFDDMIVDIEANSKLSPIVNELFLGGRKLAIPTCPAMLQDYKTKKS